MKKFIVGTLVTAGGFIAGFFFSEIVFCNLASEAHKGNPNALALMDFAVQLGDEFGRR